MRHRVSLNNQVLNEQAVEAAAAGKLAESFKRLDKMGAVAECGRGEQADELADEYVRLAEQYASAVVVSQTWAEVSPGQLTRAGCAQSERIAQRK